MQFVLLLLAGCGVATPRLGASGRGVGDPSVDTAGSDDTGQGDDTEAPADDPVAVVTAPVSVEVGEAATFDGTGSYDPAGDGLSWTWSCTDGSIGDAATVTVTTAAEGDLTCALTVRTGDGRQGTGAATTRVDALPRAAWTVMVFVNGDNSLEEAALNDVNEMEQVGSTDEVNIIIQVDRASGGTSADGNWTSARRYRVLADSNPNAITSPVLEDLGEVDSGSPQTIIDFVDWAAAGWPAEHYALVFWDHGWGWSMAPDEAVKGISEDDQSGNDISVASGEWEEVLAASNAATAQPLSLVGMDACLMQSWEMAHAAWPYADALVASQYYEADDGWDYHHALADLVADPTMDAAAFGDRIALRFYESGDTTLSVVDLREIPALDDALDDVATAVIAGDDGDSFRHAARDAQPFEYEGAPDRDLIGLLDALADRTADAAVQAAATAAADRARDAVASNYVRGEWIDANGITIYAPSRGPESLYLQGSWSDDTLWDDLLLAVEP